MPIHTMEYYPGRAIHPHPPSILRLQLRLHRTCKHLDKTMVRGLHRQKERGRRLLNTQPFSLIQTLRP